jgi:hypothetical protein
LPKSSSEVAGAPDRAQYGANPQHRGGGMECGAAHGGGLYAISFREGNLKLTVECCRSAGTCALAMLA